MRRKPFYISFAIFGVIGLVLFLVVFGVTGSLVTVADDFFVALGEGDYQEAYDHLSSEFHGNTSISDLTAFAQDSALASYSESTWWERSISGDTALLDGEVQTVQGTYVPVTIFFHKEDDVWKISQIDWEEDDQGGPQSGVVDAQ